MLPILCFFETDCQILQIFPHPPLTIPRVSYSFAPVFLFDLTQGTSTVAPPAHDFVSASMTSTAGGGCSGGGGGGASEANSAGAITSIVYRPLQLTETLRLLGGVLTVLRWSLVLLGRQPFGKVLGTEDPSPSLFRRLCSLLEFLEDISEMQASAHADDIGGAVGGGGGGGGAGGAGGARDGVFGRSFQARHD